MSLPASTGVERKVIRKKMGRDEFGGSDVGDVLKLLDISLKLPGLDADNIFMRGTSRGGMMNYLRYLPGFNFIASGLRY